MRLSLSRPILRGLAAIRLPHLSIRGRIGALSAVPLVAFGIIGFAVWEGQQRLDRSFVVASEQAAIARLTIELSGDVAAMRNEARRLAQTHAGAGSITPW